MKDELNLAQQYSDEDKARELLESLLWKDGPVCPHYKNHKEMAMLPNLSVSGIKFEDALKIALQTPPPKKDKKP